MSTTNTQAPTIQDYTKFASLQMAAEAILTENGIESYLGDRLEAALIRGNNRASAFTAVQADYFSKHWKVIEQKNTESGFSGTLFVCTVDDPVTGAKAGEKVLSFRSTEFIDDAARDNYATNQLEIFKSGFAWGQIKDMEEWYAKLKNEGQISDPSQLSVTGYSLGGHLATVFNMLRTEQNTAIGKVVTFNGAGVGGLAQGQSLYGLLGTFKAMTDQNFDYAYTVPDMELRLLYRSLDVAIRNQKPVSGTDLTRLWQLAHPGSEDVVDVQTRQQELCIF